MNGRALVMDREGAEGRCSGFWCGDRMDGVAVRYSIEEGAWVQGQWV